MSKELIERLRHIYADGDPITEEAADRIEQLEFELSGITEQLAAAQAQLKVMRDALDFVLNGSTELDQRASIDKARKALAQPTDDSALREMLAAEREKCAKTVEDYGLSGYVYAEAIRAMGSE